MALNKVRHTMKNTTKFTFFMIVVSALSGCAAGSSFTPKTPDGAMCKAKCAQDMAICQGSSYTCDRAVSTCMASCQELDNIMISKQAR